MCLRHFSPKPCFENISLCPYYFLQVRFSGRPSCACAVFLLYIFFFERVLLCLRHSNSRNPFFDKNTVVLVSFILSAVRQHKLLMCLRRLFLLLLLFVHPVFEKTLLCLRHFLFCVNHILRKYCCACALIVIKNRYSRKYCCA